MTTTAVNSPPTILKDFVALPPQPNENFTINDFNILQKLGGGMYGNVFLASVKNSNFVVALKQLNIKHLANSQVANQLRREVEIGFNVRHKYILRTYGYFYDADTVYLILEPCSRGMLYSELKRVKKYSPAVAARYVAQLGEALLYLHQHHCLHRDIKPENILLDHNSNIKLADFGWSVHDPADRRKTACGTPEYFPPEIVSRSKYGSSADLWCLGIFCFELLVGETPFVDKDQKRICAKIKLMKFEIPDTVPPEAKDLIEALLKLDGSTRLSLSRVLSHPFLEKYYYGPKGLIPPSAKRKREVLSDISQL